MENQADNAPRARPIWRTAVEVLGLLARRLFTVAVVVPAVLFFTALMWMSHFSFVELVEGYYTGYATMSPASKPGYVRVRECVEFAELKQPATSPGRPSAPPRAVCQKEIEKEVSIHTLAQETGQVLGTLYRIVVGTTVFIMVAITIWVMAAAAWRRWRDTGEGGTYEH